MKTRLIFIIYIVISLFIYEEAQAQLPPLEDIRNITTTISGITIRGEYGVFYKDASYPNAGLLTDPIIVCEGFDPINGMGLEEIYEQVDGSNEGVFFLNRMRRRGHDVVVLDLLNNSVEIEKNAELFISLIREINAEVRINNSVRQSTVVGISMGGLITRFALSRMERNNEDHRVENYVSFDSPQRGANIPLGLQHFVDFFLHPVVRFQEISSELDKLNMSPLHFANEHFTDVAGVSLINTAGQEMSAIYLRDNEVRRNFLAELENEGGYPANCRKIAVSMGRSGVGQNFGEGDKLLEWLPGVCVLDRTIELPFNLGDFGLRWCPTAFEFESTALPGAAYPIAPGNFVFQASFGAQLEINGQNIDPPAVWKSFNDRDHLTAPNNINIDHVPGGTWTFPGLDNFAEQLNVAETTIPIQWGREYCLPRVCVPFTNVCTPRRCEWVGIDFDLVIPWHQVIGRMESESDFEFSFVPTLSALDINSDDWFLDVASLPEYPYPKDRSLTPFDALATNLGRNSGHAHLEEAQMAEFLLGEINPNNLFVQNKTFSNGYFNKFQANSIVLGSNVDPVANRSNVGDVILETGSHLELVVPPAGEVVLKPGVQTNGGTMSISVNGSLPIFGNETFTSRASPFRMADGKGGKAKRSAPKEFTMPEIPVIRRTYYLNDEGKPVETEVVPEKASYMQVYPNPVSSNTHIYLNMTMDREITITVHDLFGKEVLRVKNNEPLTKGIHRIKLDAGKLKAGVYLVSLSGNNLSETQKIIKQY